jgi:hypothetical protein
MHQVTLVRPYLFRALRNELFKRGGHRRRLDQCYAGYQAGEGDVVFSCGELITQAEACQLQREALAEALNQLSRREREVIYLRYYENLPYIEVRPAGTTTVALPLEHIRFDAGKMYTVVAAGRLNPQKDAGGNIRNALRGEIIINYYVYP